MIRKILYHILVGTYLLNRGCELVTTVKAEVPNTFFTPNLNSTAELAALGTKIQVNANTELLSVKEVLMCELSQELDPYKLMGPKNVNSKSTKRAS